MLAAVAVAVAFGATASRASAPAPILFAANRAPTVTGEIYRLDPNGSLTDLSRSPALDTNPAVSPDGRYVAFISDRGSSTGVYEVRSGGGGIVAVARNVPSLDRYNGRLAWQPNGAQLAVDTGSAVSILQRGYKPVTFHTSRFGVSQPWSPDGNVLLLYQGLNTLRAVSPDGSTLWTQEIDYPVGGWSSQGLVAVSALRGVRVYDEVGRVRFAVHLPTAPAAIAWSRDGTRLAFEWGVSTYTLEVRSQDGKLLLTKRVPGGDIGWDGDRKVVLGEPECASCQAVSVDVRTGAIAPGSDRWLEPSSADGKLALYTQQHAPGFNVGVAPLPTGANRTYRNVPGCSSDGGEVPAISYPQFAGRSIVYESWNVTCDGPFDNLYAATGASIHRLTTVKAEETQPMLSPDGTKIAYVWASALGMSCKGCSDGIRIASADGKAIRTLTDPPDCTFDDAPTWSPDGTTILYSETGCDNPGELFTIPASGGTPTDLHLAGVEPAWGPTKIAYVGALDTSGGVWTANPDGSDPTLVSQHGHSPAWSATGQLAYLTGTTVVVDTTQAKLPFARVGSVRWTPDGTRLVVTASTAKSGPLDLYSLKPDGTGIVRLTKDYGVN